jgi:hypothetical protein
MFDFEVVSSAGYFRVEYGTEAPLGVDLKADGSEAFLLSFSHVSRPLYGTWDLFVNGVRYSLRNDLVAINGRGTIRSPFSRFSASPTFVVDQITLDAGRVEQPNRFVLDSIVTVNAHTPPLLSVINQDGGEVHLLWSTNATGFMVQTTPKIGDPWQTVTNTAGVVGDHFSVTLTCLEASGYFRLLRE